MWRRFVNITYISWACDGQSMDEPQRTLDDVELPENEHWDFEYETPLQGHWLRDNVPAEEVAEDSDAFSPEDYREQLSDEMLAFSMTIRWNKEGWTVTFVSPSVRRGIGDVDGRYSMDAGTLDEAIQHVEEMLHKKSPNK